MADFDRASRARIVAWTLFNGGSMSDAEAAVYRVAPGASPAQVNQALREGQLGRDIAEGINTERELPAQEAMADEQAAGAASWHVYYRVQIGPGPETDWRAGSFLATGAQTVETIRQYAEAASAAAMGGGGQGFGSGPLPLGTPSEPLATEFVWAVPLF